MTTDAGLGGHVHDALFHCSSDELVTAAISFLREGIELGEDPVLACTEPNNQDIAAALGEDARITFLPREEFCRSEPGALDRFRRLFDEKGALGARRLRLVGEVLPQPEATSWREWTRLEAVRNAAFAQLPLWSVCAYDMRELPDEIVTAGELTHPYVRRGASRIPNPSYVEPGGFLERLAAEDAHPVEATEPVIAIPDLANLQSARDAVRAIIAATNATPSVVENFVLAVNEVVGNAVRHGRPPVSLRLWVTPNRFVCAVRDTGDGFHDPFAGYYSPTPTELPEGQFGLWLVRQLTDQLSTSRTPAGFTVRISSTYTHQ